MLASLLSFLVLLLSHHSSFPDPRAPNAAQSAEALADYVSHAKFICSDMSSYEVVLMKILHVWPSSALLFLFTPLGIAVTAVQPRWSAPQQ
jgi:hypothetical protein